MSNMYAKMYGLNSLHKDGTEQGGVMDQRYTMPKEIAANQSQFQTMFYNLRKNYWENATGWALAHIVAYDLDQLKLDTPNEWSEEVKYAEIDLVELIAAGCDVPRQTAWWIVHNMYIPTDEEYEYLMKREFGDEQHLPPAQPGVYDSIDPGQEGWFAFCKSRWDAYHDLKSQGEQLAALGITKKDATDERKMGKALKAFAQKITDDWNAMSPDEQKVWG